MAGILVVAACGVPGPQGLVDGDYRLYETSLGSGSDPVVTLRLDDGRLEVIDRGSRYLSDVGSPSTRVVLCPPSGAGRPLRLDAPLAVGGLDLTRPAIFGDCGQVTPTRVTVVDLDSEVGDGAGLPFTRWAEFCSASDPDCPAS